MSPVNLSPMLPVHTPNQYRREIEQQLDGRIASRLKRDGSWIDKPPQEVGDFWDR